MMYKIKFKGKKLDNPDSIFFADEEGHPCYRYDGGVDFSYDDDYQIVRKTGVKDKNDVDIYEGDVVRYFRYNSKEYSKVDYSVVYGYASFALEYLEDDKLEHYYFFNQLKFPEFLEIINL